MTVQVRHEIRIEFEFNETGYLTAHWVCGDDANPECGHTDDVSLDQDAFEDNKPFKECLCDHPMVLDSIYGSIFTQS